MIGYNINGERGDIMKHIIRLYLFIGFIMCILVGCRSNEISNDLPSETESNFIKESTEIVGSTESETKEGTTQVKEFFDHAQEFPQCAIREVDIKSILSEKEEIRVVWDIKIFAESVYFGVTTYDETNGFSNRLVTCNSSGEDVKSITLQEPGTKSDNMSSYMIGVDGNVYAVKYEKAQTLWSCTEEGASIVSWNLDGEIRYEFSLQASDFENYENPRVNLESVSEQGEIIFSITDYYKAIVVRAASDGSVLGIDEAESGGTFYSSWINEDGSMGWLFSEGNVRAEYDMFYLTYDINSQSFSERIQVKDDVLNAKCFGKSKEALILYENGYIYKYYPFIEKIEPLAQVSEDKYVKDIAVINDESFLISYISETDSENPFEGVYMYTRVNK